MFSSCTSMGAHFKDNDSVDEGIRPNDSGRLSNSKKTAQTMGTTITPSSSSAGEKVVTPSPQHAPLPSRPTVSARAALQESSKNLFKNNHEIAEEAIKHLRQQQHKDTVNQKLNDTMNTPSVGFGSERDFSLRSNNQTISSTLQAEHSEQRSRISSLVSKTAKMPSGMTPVRSRQEHSFFPISRPRDPPGTTRQEQRAREKKERIKGVPKEVSKTSSPMRIKKNNQRQKDVANAVSGSTENEDAQTNASWDIGNDGISEITQVTIDRLMFAFEQQLLVFPEEADTLNRVHSDITDPAPNRTTPEGNTTRNPVDGALVVDAPSSSTSKLFEAMTGFANTLKVVTPPRAGDPSNKGMSPPSFTRNMGSTGTRSFFTKTTHSSQTSNFASAWRKDEQQFWDTEVAKDGSATKFSKSFQASPMRQSWAKFPKTKRSGATTATTSITTATTLTIPSPISYQRKKAYSHEETEVFLTEHDRLMDNLILQDDVEMAEI